MKEIDNAELIDIHDVTRIFNLSIEAIRKYKALGLIEPCQRVGRKDLYNEQDIIRIRNLIKSYKQEGKSLKEVVEEIKALREQQNFEEQLGLITDAKKILIIEDEDCLIDILKEFLRTRFSENEVRIYHAKDGLTGIERARRIKPDLIILDLVLPDITGIKVHEKLMKKPSTRHSKFLISSGNIKYIPENAEYIGKPIEPNEFLHKVETLIGLNVNKNSNSVSLNDLVHKKFNA